jgi:DNA mismatch endonuclease (patch repair protein)
MDRVSKAVRSRTMSAIRKRGNHSTEWKLRSALVRSGISGWVMHDAAIAGCPDFWFKRPRFAIFVDGCFWHSCRQCQIPIPQSNRPYWKHKLLQNTKRANLVTKMLRREGIRVMRVWEHELASPSARGRVLIRITKLLFDRLLSPQKGACRTIELQGNSLRPSQSR